MPIRFTCKANLPQSPEQIAAAILDTSRWPEFAGYGPLPGIKSASFTNKTESIVGSKIRVENTDGSNHSEEIVVWDPPKEIQLRLFEFSPPLSALATHFDEHWEFVRLHEGCAVVRKLALHPTSVFSSPLVWMISWLLKGAIKSHLRLIRSAPVH